MKTSVLTPLERILRAPALLVATDYDGTIAEIADTPESARALPGALGALATLSRLPSVAVAVVSGRTLDSLRERTSSLSGIWRGAEHGMILESPSLDRLRLGHFVSAEALDLLERAARIVEAATAGIRVERKKSGVALHYRGVPGVDANSVRLAPFRHAARHLGFSLLAGRKMVEARPSEPSKGTALAAIFARLAKGTLPIYAGDDRTDESAFACISEAGGLGFFIDSEEREGVPPHVDAVLPGPSAWVEMLNTIARSRDRLT